MSCHFSRSLRGNISSNQHAHEGKECNGGWSWLRVHILRLLRSEKRSTILHFIEVECQNQPYNEQVFLGSFGKILLLFPVYFDDAVIFPVASPNIPDDFSPQKFSRKKQAPNSLWQENLLVLLITSAFRLVVGSLNVFWTILQTQWGGETCWGGGGNHGTQRREGSFSPVETGWKVFFKPGKLLADSVADFFVVATCPKI